MVPVAAFQARVPRRRLLALIAGLPLAACVETAGDFDPAAAPRARAPAGVPVALVSLEGAPETVIQSLSSAIAGQAARRDITIVGIDGQPRYQLRGYLSAYPGADGKGELSWAFDVFDSQKKRAGRFSGQQAMSAGPDWSAVGESQIQAVAFKALDELAEFLAASPEATAGAGGAGAPTAGRNAARRAAAMLAAGG